MPCYQGKVESHVTAAVKRAWFAKLKLNSGCKNGSYNTGNNNISHVVNTDALVVCRKNPFLEKVKKERAGAIQKC